MPKEVPLMKGPDGLYYLPEETKIEDIISVRKNGKTVEYEYNPTSSAVDIKNIKKGDIVTAIIMYYNGGM